MRILKLNGSPIPKKSVQGLDDYEINISTNDENLAQELSFTSQLTLTGVGYQIIRQALIDPINAQFNVVNVEIWDDCCQAPLKFVITFYDVTFCDDEGCRLGVKLREDSPDQELLRKLRSKKINDPNLFNDPNRIPKFNYCVTNAHSWITHALMAVGLFIGVFYSSLLVFLIPLLTTIVGFIIAICAIIVAFYFAIYAIIWVLNTIISFVNFVINAYNQIPLLPNLPLLNLTIPQIGNIVPPICQQIFTNPLSLVQDLKDLYALVYRFLINCDDKHPAPLIRYYLDNIVFVSGATGWTSSYFGNPAKPHYNMVLLYAPVNNGDNNPPTIYGNNLPGWTCAEALDEFCKIINGRWWVNNLQIVIERKDYFLNNNIIYFDAVQNVNNVIEGACYDPGVETPYAVSRYAFQQDFREESGNEILNEYICEVDYEQLHGQNQAWENRREVMINFGGVRVRNDGLRPIIKYDALTWWQNLVFPNVLLGGQLQATNKFLMLTKGTTTIPKVIVWDVNSGVNDAKVQEYQTGNFNDPLKFKPGIGGLFWPVPNGSLYDDYGIDDPSLNPYYRYTFRIVIKFDCQLLTNALPGQLVRLPMGLGRIDNFVIRPGKTITLTGQV